MQHTFFVHFFVVVFHNYILLQHGTSRNFFVTRFMEEMSFVFSFAFFHCRSFSPCIGGLWHFSLCQRRYKIFMLFFQQKISPLMFFISRSKSSVALLLVELPWPAAYFLFFSDYQCCSIFQIYEHDI